MRVKIQMIKWNVLINYKYKYNLLFIGISSLASCGQLGALPELPPQDEERLQRAARLLQQRLVLRQWLTDHGLSTYYQK